MSEGRASWRLAPAIVLTALAAALFAIAFRASFAAVVSALGGDNVVAMIDRAPMWERLALPAAGGLAAGLVALVAARVREGAGVGFVMEAIVLGRVRIPLTRSALQAVASWLAIVGGNSLGREGPLIQFGAASGEASRRLLRLDDTTARLVLAAGVAAGFASAYNAPIAAVLFVVEIVTGVLVLEAIVPVLIATVIATVVTRLVMGGAPLYQVRTFAMHSWWALFAFAGLGLVAAPIGVMFLRWLSLVDRWWKRLPMPVRPALGGLTCGAILCGLPMVAGNGFEPLDALLDGRIPAAMVAWLLVAKPVATAASVGSGNPGGVFTPTLLIGGCVGSLFALGLGELGIAADPGSYALVGLAAALAATTHAPMTAAILACELSGDYALVLPLLVACALAAGLARRLYIDSVYTAELTRRGLRWRLTLDGRRVVENQQSAVDVV
ncbi:MAG TPA: chloride channel protein [Kofleriaceae bacterium]|nr:chloride channel protein [Kofleriaceae bacterium]